MENYNKINNRPEKKIIIGLRKLGTCAVSDAFDKLGIHGVITGINPLFSGAKIVGPIVTITQAVATHTYKGMALSKTKLVIENVAQTGDVIFVSAPGCKDFATWGEMVSIRCKVKGIEGVVIDGATRDIDKIRELRFPVFTKAFTPVCEFSRIQTVAINEHIQCNGVQIIPGDILVGDDNGITIIPKKKVDDVLRVGLEREKLDKKRRKLLRNGQSILGDAQNLLKAFLPE